MKKIVGLSTGLLCIIISQSVNAVSLEQARQFETLVGQKNVSVTKDNYSFAALDMAMNEEVKHGATNKFYHHRMPMEIDKQPAVLMNRDTLYSFAIIDASHGAR